MDAPTFIVAGAQKSATTWLYECLNEHPDVIVPQIKELHFFCNEELCPKSRWGKGFDWYSEQFASNGPQTVAGELSIDYMYFPDTAEKLHRYNPDLKVLFILRDPVERAYSAYWMGRRSQDSYPPFSEFVRPDSDFVARGFYHRQIQRYLEYFPAEQLKVLIYEDIPKDPYAFLSEVFEFIGVAPDFRPNSAKQIIAETRDVGRFRRKLIYRFAQKALKFPPLLWAWRKFKHLTGVKQAKAGAEPSRKYPPMTEEQFQALSDIYAPETKALFRFLGRFVGEWKSAAGLAAHTDGAALREQERRRAG